MYNSLVISSLLLLQSTARSQSLEATDCGLLGPVYPIPANYKSLKAIQTAQNDWTRAIDEAIQQLKTPWGPLDPANNSISIGVFSTQSDDILTEFHHAPTRSELQSHLTSGKLDGDSLYRVGSVTKMLSTYAALSKLHNNHWSEPVTNFIPDLQHKQGSDPVHNFNWSSITLANLVNHMGGLPHDYSLTDLSSTPEKVPPVLPPLNGSEIVKCSGLGQPACSREESLELMFKQNPLAPSWHTPVYSNNGYDLLGLALENITGESFIDVFNANLVEPLKLKRTFLNVPEPKNDPNAVLAEGDGGSWLTDLGQLDPAGSAWSSLYDLSTIGRSILSSSILPPHVQRQWLKPETHTAHPDASIGKAWEIFRMHVALEPDSNATRLADLYTKNGGLVGYNAEMILSPDHGIGIAVLVANLDESNDDPSATSAGTLWALNELATSIWIAAAEAAAREDAAAKYTGTFASEDGLNSSITLTVTSGRRGLDITQLVYNGTDYLAYMAAAMGRAGGHLQYMGLGSDGQLAFRAVWQSAKWQGPEGVFVKNCLSTWTGVDSVKYGGFGDDEFIISADGEDGKATGIEMPFLRTKFSKRVEGGRE